MLHILWLILKFILIILGILLGLVLLAVSLDSVLPCEISGISCEEGKDAWKQIRRQRAL